MDTPWQLKQYRRSVKKQLKMAALLDFVGDNSGQDCLLITCGDNTGALNWQFREHGGNWSWGDVQNESIPSMAAFLEEAVHHMPPDRFPFPDRAFDCLVSLDVLEHLESDQPFLGEASRVLWDGGRAIVTVPNGDPGLLANRIKWRLGMTPLTYGHSRAGYTVNELQSSLRQAGFLPTRSGGYARFFTELVELAINFGYVRVLNRSKGAPKTGQIAPTSSEELKAHGTSYRVYSSLYPFLRAFSALDRLLPETGNNAVIVEAIKPHQGSGLG